MLGKLDVAVNPDSEFSSLFAWSNARPTLLRNETHSYYSFVWLPWIRIQQTWEWKVKNATNLQAYNAISKFKFNTFVLVDARLHFIWTLASDAWHFRKHRDAF